MNKADCFNLGYVAKLHGYKGEVSLFFDTTHPEEYRDLKTVFIEIDGVLIPFFIEKIELMNKGFAKVKFDGVNSENEARNLLKKQLFLPLTSLPELSGNHFYDHEIIGFTVIDSNFGVVGAVLQVIDYTQNPLLQIHNKEHDKEVLLPLNNELIKEINREKKEIHVEAIPGLIEMYLE